jgi:hypothetical protein
MACPWIFERLGNFLGRVESKNRSGWLSGFEESFTAYELASITWPGFRHMRRATPSRLVRAFTIAIGLGFITRVLLGLIPYLTFFDGVNAMAM